jgi:hypothetical protein
MKFLVPANYLRLELDKIYIIAKKGENPYIHGAKHQINYVDYTANEIGCTTEANKMKELGYRKGYFYVQNTTGSLLNDNTEFNVSLDLANPMMIYQYE